MFKITMRRKRIAPASPSAVEKVIEYVPAIDAEAIQQKLLNGEFDSCRIRLAKPTSNEK